MIGTILNAAGILLGGLVGLIARKPLSPAAQQGLKAVLGVLTIFVGLKMTWTSLAGGSGSGLKQLVIVVLAMILGRLTGQLAGLQKLSNRLGQIAKEKMSAAGSGAKQRLSEGFIICTVLYCVGPMAILGAVQDGLAGQWQVLGLKAVIDGLATMAFVSTFGWSVMLSVVPLVAYQGTLTLGAMVLAPHLQPAWLNSVNATSGLLVFSVALVMLGIKKVELADYLPSLAFAPLLTWVWR